MEAAWHVVDPILKSDDPVFEYERGTWGPSEAGQFAKDSGGWLEPCFGSGTNQKL